MRTVVAIQLIGIVLNLPRSDLCKFGTYCDYPCHCQNNVVCDPLDGSCPAGCDDGDLEEPGDYWYTGAWGGYGCQIGNVAYGKNATQGPFTHATYIAGFGVDGGHNPTFHAGPPCTHTTGRSAGWWQVDLGVNFVIYGVDITNRDVYKFRLRYTDITVSDTEGGDGVRELCHRIGSEGSAAQLSINSTHPGYRLTVLATRIAAIAGGNPMTFIELIGTTYNECGSNIHNTSNSDCPDTYYGVGCGTPCNCQLPCHDISGECPHQNCTEGWMGSNCQTVCNPGTWGTNCQQSCNCLDDQEECDRFMGRCDSGCHGGFGVLPMLNSSTVEFSDPTSNSIEVRFNARVPGNQEEHIPSGYIVQRRDSVNATWLHGTEIDHDIDTVHVIVVLRGLEPESEYYLRVVPFIVDGGEMSLGHPTAEVGPFRTLRNEISGGTVSVGVIMSVVLVLVIIILIIGGVLLFFRRRKNRKKVDESVCFNSGIAQLQRTVAESDYEIPNTPTAQKNEHVYSAENNNEDKTSRETPEYEYAEIADPKITAEMSRHDGYDGEYENVMVEEPDPVDHTYGNQVFVGRLLRADELGPHVEEMSRRKDAFTQIPAGMTAKANEGLKTINRKRNRFNDISAYDHSRVILNCSPEEKHCTDYINASFIHNYKGEPKRYIAAQGPKKSTVGYMWSMVWQACANRIVMLTNLIDAGKVKCEQYWPSQGVATFGKYKVTQVNTEMFANYTIRILSLAHANGESRPVYQFHFTGWPDYEVPELTTAILDFRRKVRSYDDKAKGPMIVHCSAGVGRTGAFLAIDTLLDQLKEESRVDVLRYTMLMREDRVNMIQTLAQYVFVYEMLLEATQIGETAIPSNEMEDRYTELQLPSTEAGRSAIDEQFAVLRLLRKKSKPRSVAEALIKGNEMKNRDPKVIPLEKYRPHLNTSFEGTNDYINAVNVDGYRDCKAYIATQLPLSDTVVDLWRMLYERKCSSIVSLQQPNHDDESTPVFWPTEEDTPMIVMGLSVTLLKEEVLDEGDIKMMEFEIAISMKNPSDTRVIRMYQLLDWQTGKVPPSLETTLKLLDHAERWQMRSGLGGICYQCMHGYERCGLMIAACYMLEKLKVDREADVFQAVKQVRISRPEFVTSKSQYRFLHELAIAYINSCEDYANFK